MRRFAAIAGVALATAGAAAVVALWWTSAEGTGAAAGPLAEIARLCGLLGAYLVLIELLLLARLPLLDRPTASATSPPGTAGTGAPALSLLVAHALLIVDRATRATDDRSLPAELVRLIEEFPGVITALAGLVLLIAVVVSSAVIVRRRLRYETWYFVHLYAYLAVALAFSHQLATGTDVRRRPLARTFWTALYVATLAAIVGFRLGVPRRAEPAPPAARRARRRGGAGRRVGRDRGHRPRPARARAGQFFALALPDPRPLVGVAPVLALGRARRPPAADHRQGGRRLHARACARSRRARA